MKAQTGSKEQLCSFFILDARWGWVVNVTCPPLYARASGLTVDVQEAGLNK
jgi:hypothetical protein